MKTPDIRKLKNAVRGLWDESALRSPSELSKLEKFTHFWLMAGRSFARNRCPMRASALAYASLLALVPMLAVAMGITSTLLKKEGEDRIDQFIGKMVGSLTPPAALSTNITEAKLLGDDAGKSSRHALTNQTSGEHVIQSTNQTTMQSEASESAQPQSASHEDEAVRARRSAARNIHHFIQNTRSGTLGVTGSVLLIFVAISMLTRIEDTFNDIWGVERGRSWFMRVVVYWGVITLAPVLLIVALGLASGPHLESTRRLLTTMPVVSELTFHLLPVAVLCLTFSLFYMLMPNTKVDWRAALVGGLVGGLLFHGNNLLSVLYVSRVVSNFKIYGSLGLVPVFMVGLYLSWLILLFGAQVAYAFQNRRTYLEERQIENINQRGREFIALRLMTCISQRFTRGEPPPGAIAIADELSVPTRLVHQVMQTLCAAHLACETAGSDPGYLPSRPLETITCHDILEAMRASQGQELATRDEPVRREVYGEFHRIQEAERAAAGAVTMLALANRAQAQIAERGE